MDSILSWERRIERDYRGLGTQDRMRSSNADVGMLRH